MSDNSKPYLIQGKALERYFDFHDALAEFHKLFNLEKKDERTISILGGTFLEMALENLLREFFPDEEKDVDNLFMYPQALANFSNKINLAFCLGLIDKVVKDDLKLVKNIRNKFAHDLYVSFDDAQIKSWVRELKFHKISMLMDAPFEATELQIFQVGVNQLITNLHGYISLARGEKRKIRDKFKTFL